MIQKTPLYDRHVSLGGKMVPYEGYLLPLQYLNNASAEHVNVRTECGMFDNSYLGKISCTGPDAMEFLNRIVTNDIEDLYDGQRRFTLICSEEGGIIDDINIYKVQDGRYLLGVHAANKGRVLGILNENKGSSGVIVKDITEEYAHIGVYGPNSEKVISKLIAAEFIPKFENFGMGGVQLDNFTVLLIRQRYAGEKGFEVLCGAENADTIWGLLMWAGGDYGIMPCGLSARDTLRVESGQPHHGRELTEDTTPFEAGLGQYVKMTKQDFIGKIALQSKAEPKRRLMGIKVLGDGVLREYRDLYMGSKLVGKTTSGIFCPYLNGACAMAYIDVPFDVVGTKLKADVGGKETPVQIVEMPFYRK